MTDKDKKGSAPAITPTSSVQVATAKILKVSSKDGSFVRGGIAFPQQPDFITLNVCDLTNEVYSEIQNEPALIVKFTDKENKDSNTKQDDNDLTNSNKTVKELHHERQELFDKLEQPADQEKSEWLKKELMSGIKKTEILQDIEDIKALLHEQQNVSDDENKPTSSVDKNTGN